MQPEKSQERDLQSKSTFSAIYSLSLLEYIEERIIYYLYTKVNCSGLDLDTPENSAISLHFVYSFAHALKKEQIPNFSALPF